MWWAFIQVLEGLEALKGVLEHREDKTISTDTLLKLAHVVLKSKFFEFKDNFYQQLMGTAIGTKCATSYVIVFLAALEEKLFAEAQYKAWVWWRYIDDVFLIWQHGDEKLRDFITFFNGAHDSIKIYCEWSTERVNFLDVQVIEQDNNLMTDLFTKPTDTHQLLHRASCHTNQTKKGIPYS